MDLRVRKENNNYQCQRFRVDVPNVDGASRRDNEGLFTLNLSANSKRGCLEVPHEARLSLSLDLVQALRCVVVPDPQGFVLPAMIGQNGQTSEAVTIFMVSSRSNASTLFPMGKVLMEYLFPGRVKFCFTATR